MNLPLFLDIEYSQADDGRYPIVISWSLSDGSIKSVMVCPDDDWDPWDNASPEIDIQHLLDQGVSGPDIIREINQDLSGQTVFLDGLDEDEELVEMFFETYDEDPDFEMTSISQLYPQLNYESLLDMRRQIAEQEQFDLNKSDDVVRSMLYLNRSISD